MAPPAITSGDWPDDATQHVPQFRHTRLFHPVRRPASADAPAAAAALLAACDGEAPSSPPLSPPSLGTGTTTDATATGAGPSRTSVRVNTGCDTRIPPRPSRAGRTVSHGSAGTNTPVGSVPHKPSRSVTPTPPGELPAMPPPPRSNLTFQHGHTRKWESATSPVVDAGWDMATGRYARGR